jgi:ABC-type cobalamin/Fe3+-siderophores transport system ATPase subunit
MEYLREMHKDGRFQTQMVLIMVGEAESGKSTLLKAFQALSAPPKEQEEVSSPQSVKGGNGKDGGGNGTSAAAAPAAATAAGGGADGNDGKAVAGDEGVRAADGTYVPTVGVVMHKWVPKGEDRRLSFLTLDMGGSMHYSVVHEFFMTRGTYLLTFRALDETYDEKEKSAHHVNSVKR